MENYDNYKEFYSERTIDELKFNLIFYRSRLELLTKELDFFNHMMESNIYDPKTLNIHKTFESFKKRMVGIYETKERLFRDINQQYNDVALKIECDELSCDDYFIRRNYELELEVVNFLMKSDELTSEMMEYLQNITE